MERHGRALLLEVPPAQGVARVAVEEAAVAAAMAAVAAEVNEWN
tara:strand:+ start:100 stop:231 length:132 start_codon:yes stop_codon:yes gene_type:complete